MSLISELKRRNVIRVGAMYVALAWLLVQVGETVLPLFDVEDSLLRTGVIALAVGFIPALLLAWFFEWTPEGIVPDADVDHDAMSGRRRATILDRLLVLVLVLGIAFFAWDKFVLDPGRDAAELEAAREAALAEGRSEALAQARSASIAVLPFRDRSASGELAYLAEGLAEDILNDLARIASLRVTARTSAFSFEPGEATSREIGEALNVAHILEGSLSQSGGKLRVAVQLVDADSATTLWSEQYDRSFGDLFAIRDDISARVVARLPVRQAAMFGTAQRTDPEAYALTLRGRAAMAGGRDSDPAKARALIDQALAIDPDYIPALVSSFYIDYALMRERKMSPERAQSRYRKTIDRIFELDPNNAMALAAEAFGRWETENNWEQAAEEFGAALAGAPGNIEILRLSAQFARHVGRSDIAVELLEKVAALDPLNTGNLFALPRTYLTADRYEDAVAWFKLHERISGGAIYYYAMALLMLGRQDEVLSVLDAAKEFIDHPHPQMLAMRAMAHHANGNLADRDHFLAEAAAVALDDAPYGPYLLAEAYAFAGDNDAAFEWIEIAFETDRLYGLTGWWFRQILALPVWRSLHADPRWSAAREQVGMSEARMAAIELNLVP